MSRTHNLNRARNIFLAAARLNKHCHPAKYVLAVQMADAIENAIETLDEREKRIHQLETELMNANDRVKLALDALDTAEKTAAGATQALSDAKANGILNDENTARLVARFPEPVEPPPAA